MKKSGMFKIMITMMLVLLLVLAIAFPIAATSVQTATVNSNLGGNSFKFVQLTDLHIGEGVDDYGTAGYNDTAPSGDVGIPAQNLRAAVNWINTNKTSQGIAFVMVTGDMTDSGEKSEFLKAKEILDTLQVPYVPLIGNHDIWSYTASTEASMPVGDQYFRDIFAPAFTSLKSSIFTGWSDGTRLTACNNTEQGITSYFQNFSFNYRGYHLMCADFNTRAHAISGYKGSLPEADLYDITGGTWKWFRNDYSAFTPKGTDNMLIFSHHPMTKDVYGGVMSFSVGEYDTVASYLNDNNNKYYTGLWMAGHMHRNSVYNVKTWSLSTICPGIETGACKDGNLRVVTVYGAN